MVHFSVNMHENIQHLQRWIIFVWTVETKGVFNLKSS